MWKQVTISFILSTSTAYKTREVSKLNIPTTGKTASCWNIQPRTKKHQVPKKFNCWLQLLQNSFQRFDLEISKKIHNKSSNIKLGTDGKTQINRGCVVTAKNDNDTCQLLSTSNVAVEKCSLCKKDSCNSSSALMSSMALILASAVIIFFRQF